MIPKQDRQGVRQAREIEQKYDLNKDFSEIQQMAANAQRAAEHARNISVSAEKTAREAEAIAAEAKVSAGDAKKYTDDQLKLLWENETPTEFEAQTIEVDLRAHELVAIKFLVKDAIYKTVIGSVGDVVLMDAVCPTTETSLLLAYRKATTSDSGITFEGGMYQTNGVAPTNDDTYIIPCQIYGVLYREAATDGQTTTETT